MCWLMVSWHHSPNVYVFKCPPVVCYHAGTTCSFSQSVSSKVSPVLALERKRVRFLFSPLMNVFFVPPGRPVDPPAAISPTHTPAFPVPDSSCSIQMQEIMFNDIQPQFGDVMLPSNGYSTNNNPCSSISFNTSLPLHPTSPLPWCHGLSSDADFYGNGMVSSAHWHWSNAQILFRFFFLLGISSMVCAEIESSAVLSIFVFGINIIYICD